MKHLPNAHSSWVEFFSLPRALFHLVGLGLIWLLLSAPWLTAAASNAPGIATPAGKTQHLTSPEQVPNGVTPTEWHSIRAAYEAGRHAFQPVAGAPGHWQARNPGQHWQNTFDGRGFVTKPRDGDWSWGLALRSYGFGAAQQPVGQRAQVGNAGQRLNYQWDDTVQEWFVNDARGLEHGFTLRQRPSAGASTTAPLALTLAVRGSLQPAITADGQGVNFRKPAGGTVLTYAGLKVWDADGKTLPAHFAADGARALRLLVDERGASYPLTIDPLAQQAYVKASNTGARDFFGDSVAVSGDTMVVGAPREDSTATGVDGDQADNSAADAGAAYVFTRTAGVWTQQAYLKASNTGAGDKFGVSVAVSGDTVVVGAHLEDSDASDQANNSAADAGAAYVFTRTAGVWTYQAYLKANNTGAGDEFGISVAISGDTVVVGAYLEDSNATGVNGNEANNSATDTGATYVFTRSAGVWTQQAVLNSSRPTTGPNDWFGQSVALDGDTIVIGAFLDKSGATGVGGDPTDTSASASGAAYVFTRTAGVWTQQAYLKASNTEKDDNFGISVAVSGDTLVVGAYGEGSNATGVNGNQVDNSAFDAGAAYLFTRSGTTWTQQAYLKASNTEFRDNFGTSVAVAGDTVVVGAKRENGASTGVNGNEANNSATDAGAVYVFALPEIAVSGNSTDITDGDTTPRLADHTNFGNVAVTGGSLTRTFTVTSTGGAVTSGSVTIGGSHAADFSVSQQPGSPVIPGNATTFQITFNPSGAGVRSATLSFSTNDDDENPFNFNIQGTGTGVTVTPSSGLVTTEAAGSANFSVVLDAPPTANVTINLSSSDPSEGTVAPASLTFTAANWNTAQTVTVSGADDLVDDGDITYSITTTASSADPGYNGIPVADVGVSNTDNDTAGVTLNPTSSLVTTEASGSANFSVVLTSQPTADVTINLTSSDTTEGTVPANITFTPANWNTAQTVTVSGADDLVDDGDIAYNIVTTASSADPGYNTMTVADVGVSNTDNDTAGVTVNPTSGLVTTEAGGSANFTVVLDSQPTADVTIDLSSSDTSEGTVAPASLIFTSANWNTAQTVTVTGADDLVDDGDIAYSIVTTATSTDPGYNTMTVVDVGVSNTDNDTAGVTVNPTSGLVTTEAGGTANFTVVLNSQPTAEVSIDLSSSDTSEGTVTPASLIFTAANWNTAQTVTVTGVDDAVDDGDSAYNIVTTASSADPGYNGMTVANVGLTNNDTAGITVSPTSGLVTTEAGGTAKFSIVLASQPTAEVSIGLISSDPSEGKVAPASLTFTTANWNVAQTVTVTGVPDLLDDGNIAYSIITAQASSTDTLYAAINPADVALSNVNDAPLTGITGLPASSHYQEGQQPDQPVALWPALAFQDRDGGLLQRATVTIQGFLSKDWLLVDPLAATPNLMALYDPIHGVLTLSGSADETVYRQVLQSVRFFTTKDITGPEQRQFLLTVTDAYGHQVSGQTQMTLSPSVIIGLPSADTLDGSYAADLL